MQIHANPDQDVVVVLNADAPNGRQVVQILVRNGHRVVICARHASDLTKMLHGYDADRVMAIAADATDPRQLREVCRRATDRFYEASRRCGICGLPRRTDRVRRRPYAIQ
ncbi:putative short-chain dehydrogenase/reductase [Mycobacteroides abscessus subsp. abscessus]|nr:putative short-chain dehydrogenase/reductase [Mycobacteroides abscessus subsp. abscessus]